MFITMRTRKSLGEVRQRFEEAAAANRFAVLGTHDVGERLRAKGLQFDRKFYVYEVCNPVAAKKVLDTNVRIGTALPCRVTWAPCCPGDGRPRTSPGKSEQCPS